LLTQSRWEGADLRELISEELSPYCRQGDGRAQIVGTNVALEPMAAQSIAIVLHELATNAVKYGALSVPTGHVRVEWLHPPEGGLVMRWAETAGLPSSHPHAVGSVPMSPTDWCAVNFGERCASIGAWRDWRAKSTFPKTRRRARLYEMRTGKTEADEHSVAESLPEATA
jgi:hypothetical protein